MIKNKFLFVILVSLIISGCSELSFLGLYDEDEKLPGKRISVFKKDSASYQEDQSLSNIKISIPGAETLNIWKNSNGSQDNYPENIALSSVKDHYKIISTVKFSKKIRYLTATPIVTKDEILVTAGGGTVIALDKSDPLKILWKKEVVDQQEIRDSVGGGMAYQNGIVYVSTGQKDVVALNVKNGKEIWRHSLDNAVRAAPIIQNDKLFILTIDNKLYFIDLLNGSSLWINDGATEYVGLFGSASIAVNGNIVIVPHSSGQIHALDIYNGTEIWSANLVHDKSLGIEKFSDIDITPVIKDGIIYVAGNMGSIYAINEVNGIPLWKSDIRGIRSFWVAGNFLYITNSANEVIALERASGKIKWVKKIQFSKENKKNKISGPVMAAGKLIIVNNAGQLYVISPFDGSIEKEVAIPKGVGLIPVIADDSIYLFNNRGQLIIL